MPRSKKKRAEAAKEIVFLSGTDHVKDVLSQVYNGLKRWGFKPWWFRKLFPNLDINAMNTCLEAAGLCQRLVLVLDEKKGLPYPPTGTSITEAEFNVAHARGIECLVFIRDRVWHQSPVYHKWHSKHGRVDEKQFKELMLNGDQEIYEFIERIQHKKLNGKPAVPWITPFSLGDEVVKVIRSKWLISDKDQLAVLTALRKTAEQVPRVKRPQKRRRRLGTVTMTQTATSGLEGLSTSELNRFVAALKSLERGAAFDPKNPLGMSRIRHFFGVKDVMVFPVGKLFVVLYADRQHITILAIGRGRYREGQEVGTIEFLPSKRTIARQMSRIQRKRNRR